MQAWQLSHRSNSYPQQSICSSGLLYLVAIMDWFTCKFLAWRRSYTGETEFGVECDLEVD